MLVTQIIGEFDVDSRDNSHAWRLHRNMYNSNDCIFCILAQVNW